MLPINYFEAFFYILISIFLICTILLIFLYEWRSPSHRRKCRKLPKPKFKPIVGFALDVIRLKDPELLDFLENLMNKLGPLVYVEMFGIPHVLSIDPEDVEQILNSSRHITKGLEYTALASWLCKGLLTSSGAKWHTRRKMLTPTFHFKILENYVSVFNRNANLLTKKLLQSSGEHFGVDVDSYVSLCTLDIICETTMGTRLDSQMGNAREYVASVRRAGEIIMQRVLSFWQYKDWVFFNSPIGREFTKIVKSLHSFTEKVIQERKAMYNSNHHGMTEFGKHNNRKSFLDLLIEMQKENPDFVSDVDIREEVDTFMFEGHDTTSMAITWTLYLLAKNPDVQEKVREEIWSIFGESDREATIQDLHELRYLEMVIKECLRLYPSVPYISRFLTSDLHLKKYIIPAKTNVAVIPFLVHRNPTYYPDPEKFDPERFLPEEVKKRHPFAYIPFSAGFRNCIGQKFAMIEEKIIISTILRKLIIKEGPVKQELKALPQVICRPYPKIVLSFTSSPPL